MNEKEKDFTKPWVDPDDVPELTDEFFAKGKKLVGDTKVADEVFRDAVKIAKRGRPRKDAPKLPVSIRLSQEVVEYFRSTGTGWQTRMDQVLREYVDSHR